MKTIYRILLLFILYLFSINISAQVEIDNLDFVIDPLYKGYVNVGGRCVTSANITIPEEVLIDGKKYKVSRVREGGFQNNVKIKTVVLPKSFITISEYAFEGCSSLTNIVLNENLKSIQRIAFKGCSGLTQLTLPSSIQVISYDAFKNCNNIKIIKIKVKEPFETYDGMFDETVLQHARLIVPAGTKELYSKTKGWDLFKHIEEETTGIETVSADKSFDSNSSAAYNLSGQKVSDGYKGIVIKNGKKFLIK